MASADTGFPNVTDHGVGNRREENLHAQFPILTGRSLRFAAPDAVQPTIDEAVVVPAGSGRRAPPTYAVSGSRTMRFLAATSRRVIRAFRTSKSGTGQP